MPYEILHPSPRCWTVVNTDTGAIHAKCSTKKNAQSQMRLLYAIEKGWKPTGKKMDGGSIHTGREIYHDEADLLDRLERFMEEFKRLSLKEKKLKQKI